MSSCPFCDDDTGHVNNHVRMKNDDEHGPQGTYPDDWNPDTRAVESPAGEGEKNRSDENESDDELELEGDGQESASDVELEADDGGDEKADLEFKDTMADASEYECGECGTGLEYLGGDNREEGGKECPNCGERLFWSMM